jgi:hypothetical protein
VPRAQPAKPTRHPSKAGRPRRRETPPTNEGMGDLDGRNFRTDL